MEWWIWITWEIVFCIRYSRLFRIFLKGHVEIVGNPSIKIYVNKIENRIIFKVKDWYTLELLIQETMKLYGSTESKIPKDEYGENVPRLEITEAVSIQLKYC